MPASRSATSLGPGRPARQQSLRDHNLALALRVVADAAGPVSRAQIAAATGLTRATASTLVELLLTGGLLTETALLTATGSGRPAVGLALASGGLGGLGLEVNVDYLAVTVADLTGEVVLRKVLDGDQRGRSPDVVLKAAARLAGSALATAHGRGLRVAGIAVSVPGLVRDGRLVRAPNLGWYDVDVLAALRRHPSVAALGLSIDNEANDAARSEVTAELRSFLFVSGEIGVGAGIVLDGVVFRGTRGWAGELGHVSVDPAGPRCRCGGHGCLEVVAGLEAVTFAAGLTPTQELPHGIALATAAEGGHSATLAALEAAAGALATALGGALHLLDVGTVVLGGAYARLAPWLVPTLTRCLQERLLWSSWEAPVVRPAAQGAEAASLGGARSVVARLLSEPERWLVI